MPTPREQLSEALRNARIEAGFRTQSKLAQRLNLSRPAISKAESPKGPVPSDPLLAAWAGACRVPVEEFQEIINRIKSGHAEWFGPWLQAEQEATRLRFWEPWLIPGICQSEAYARSIAKSEAVVTQRLDRQKQVLGRAQVTVVIGHQALSHEIGSPAVMAEACGHLARLAESELITLHVVPKGTTKGLGGALAIASHKWETTVNMSTMTRGITSMAGDMIDEANAAFDMILGLALPPVPSLEFARQMEETWKQKI